MAARPLRQDEDQQDDDSREDGRGKRTAPFEAPRGDRLVEEVADRRAQRPSQDEGRPEQDDTADPSREVKEREDDKPAAEHQGTAAIAKSPAAFAQITRRP